jgi:exodeoxyribonuclease V alpha subunit
VPHQLRPTSEGALAHAADLDLCTQAFPGNARSLLLEEIDGEPLIFMPHLRRAEDGIPGKVRRLVAAQVAYPPIEMEKAMAWCEQRTGKTLAPSQREALKTALFNRAAIITSAPGVGIVV